MIFECRFTLVRGNVVGIIFRLLILKIWERIFPGKFQWERGKIWDPINSIMFFLLKPSILQYKPFFCDRWPYLNWSDGNIVYFVCRCVNRPKEIRVKKNCDEKRKNVWPMR